MEARDRQPADRLPRPHRLATTANDGTVRVWTLADGKAVVIKSGAASRSVTFLPDGKLLAVGHDAGLVRLWDSATLKPVAKLVRPGKIDGLQYTVTALAVSPDGKFLAAGSGAG